MVPSVHIIGCGLIGTSIALSLRKSGYKVSAEDINADHVAQAQDLGVSATLSRQQPGENLIEHLRWYSSVCLQVLPQSQLRSRSQNLAVR